MGLLVEDKQQMQQEREARRQDLLVKQRSLDQAEVAAERHWAKLTEDVSAKVCGALAHSWSCRGQLPAYHYCSGCRKNSALYVAMAFYLLITDGTNHHTPHQDSLRIESHGRACVVAGLYTGGGVGYKACVV